MLLRFYVRINRFFCQLGKHMGRRPRDSSELFDRRSFFGLLSLSLLTLLPTLFLFGMIFGKELGRASLARLHVPIAGNQWKTLYLTPQALAVDYSDPTLPILWESPTDRDQPEHFKRLQEIKNGVLWIGKIFTEQELAKAYFNQANILFLGKILGRYHVYLDGEQIVSGNYTWLNGPLFIPISMKRLESGQPMHLAIEVINDEGLVHPDLLGQEYGEGFTTSSWASELTQKILWNNHSGPFLFSLVYLSIGSFFLIAWFSGSRKQEYAFFAAYVFLQALMQMDSLDSVRSLRSTLFWNQLNLGLLVGEGTLALLLGLSFARVRRSWITPLVITSIVVGFLPFLLRSPSYVAVAFWEAQIFRWFIPLAYLRGGVSCLIQWHYLRRWRRDGSLILRQNTLLKMGLALSLIGTLAFAESWFLTPNDFNLSYFKLIHVGILLSIYIGSNLQERRRFYHSFKGSRKQHEQPAPARHTNKAA
jgi:hypothetical protein